MSVGKAGCGGHGRHLLKRCASLQPAAQPPRPSISATREQNIRFAVVASLAAGLPPADPRSRSSPEQIAFVAENAGGWSGERQAMTLCFNCRLPVCTISAPSSTICRHRC